MNNINEDMLGVNETENAFVNFSLKCIIYVLMNLWLMYEIEIISGTIGYCKNGSNYQAIGYFKILQLKVLVMTTKVKRGKGKELDKNSSSWIWKL